MTGEYPRELARDVRLGNGAWLHIRPIRADDEAGLLALFNRLSRATRYQRFGSPIERLPSDWVRHFANVDYRERLALVAEREEAGALQLVGVARYEPADGEEGTREIAIVVEDRWQGKGLGIVLLNDLLRAAEARGVRRFRALVLADNRRVLRMLARVANIVDTAAADGVLDLVFTRRTAGQAPAA